MLYWIFKDSIKYGAIYQITVHSMPAHYRDGDRNEVVKDVKVPGNQLLMIIIL